MFQREFILLTLILALALPLAARSKPKTATVDLDYISALATADKFLHAWQAHDEETAVLLLSDHVREHSNADAVTQVFSTRTEQAYELSPGRKLAPGRYQFPIALYTSPGDSARHWTHPRVTTLIVIRTPKGDWLVDNLP